MSGNQPDGRTREILVSVILPTRNRARLLPRAVESVLSQTLTSIELIIVDDASDDGTSAVTREYAGSDPRVKLRRLGSPVGAAAARNRGVAAARGAFIAFLDDDDEWLSHKLEHQLNAIETTPQTVGLVHTAFLEIDTQGRERLRGTRSADNDSARSRLLKANFLGNSSVLVRRSDFEAVGGFDERLPRLQDWDLWIRLAGLTGFAFVPIPLARIHAVPGSISTNRDALRHAASIMLHKFEDEIQLGDSDLADLRYGIGRVFMEHGITAEGRRFILQSLRHQRWRPQNILMLLLSLAGTRGYRMARRFGLGVRAWVISLQRQATESTTAARLDEKSSA